jgi:hypothetical protein
MASFYRDRDYPDFYWVKSTAQDLIRRGINYWHVDPLVDSKFLVQNFLSQPLDFERNIPLSWIIACRADWVDLMHDKSRSSFKNLKPNPALPILQRLSGFDEKKLREIIAFGD